MNDNRTLLTTNVTSGRTVITSDPGGAIDVVEAYKLLMWRVEN